MEHNVLFAQLAFAWRVHLLLFVHNVKLEDILAEAFAIRAQLVIVQLAILRLFVLCITHQDAKLVVVLVHHFHFAKAVPSDIFFLMILCLLLF
jgi:hypothetical protein